MWQVSVDVLGVRLVASTKSPVTSKSLNDVLDQGYGIVEYDVV